MPNNSQHRCAAIAHAVKENPALADETISVLLFNYENRERVQQMFSDLNRFVVKTSKSLDILYDKRDPVSQATLRICELVPVFQGTVDKDAVSIGVRSPKLPKPVRTVRCHPGIVPGECHPARR